MKYRSDFVTNSSSTSFGASLISAVIGLIASLGCACEQEEELKEDDPNTISIARMPEGANKIVCGEGEPIWLYAQFVRTNEEGETSVDPDVTSTISFSVSSGRGWVVVGSPVFVEDWVAVDITGVESSQGGQPPSKVTIKVSAKDGKKAYRRSVSFAYEAPPKLVVKPDKAGLLSSTGDVFDAEVSISPAGADPWELSVDIDSWALKVCQVSLEDVSENGAKATLRITESDTEEPSGTRFTDYYQSGKVTVRATCGDKEVSDYVTVTIYREGLYVYSGLSGDPRAVVVSADTSSEGIMAASEMDICYLKWSPEQKRLVSDPDYLIENLNISDPEAADEGTSNLLSANPLTVAYDRVRPSNIPSVIYKLSLAKVVPGKADERHHCSINLSLDEGENSYSLDIPVAIKPAQMDKASSWQQEVEYCKRIINTYMPEEKREAKLEQLEKNKHYMGVADLQMFRRECWNIAHDALVKEARDYRDVAAWYDNAIYAAEWTVWLTDRAFAAIAGTVFGPVGSLAAGYIKNSVADIIVKCEENWDKDWYTICSEIVWSRLQDAVGSGIDSSKFSDPATTARFIASFVAYKFVWHLYFDEDDSGNRKGVVEALKSAGWDLTGVAMEKALEPFVKSKAQRDGLVANENLDELVKDVVAVIKATLASMA